MTTSFRDLARRSMKSINYLSRSQTPSASELDDALNTFNELLGSLNRQNLALYCESRLTFATTANIGDYTWGTGGSITTLTRPDNIDKASYLIGTGTSQLEQPIHVIRTFEEWQAYPLKRITSTYPDRVWYDSAFPLGNLYIRPIPTQVLSMIFYVLIQFTAITDVDAAISLPDGALRMLRYNLAVELGAEFNMPVRPDILALAQSSLGEYKSGNTRPRPISPDPACLTGSGGGDFNILAGDNSGKLLHS